MKPKHHKIVSERTLKITHGRTVTRYVLKYDAKLLSQGACQGLDTEIFYPATDTYDKEEHRMFERMCVDCPIMEACLEWALAHERYGVWGGTTPDMRQRIRRRIGWDMVDPSRKSI